MSDERSNPAGEAAEADGDVAPDAGGVGGDGEADEILAELFAVIQQRERERPEGSYTASLFDAGENRVLEKLGEETTEVLLAAKDGDRDELVHEAADVVYHLLVLLAMEDLTLDDLRAKLRERR